MQWTPGPARLFALPLALFLLLAVAADAAGQSSGPEPNEPSAEDAAKDPAAAREDPTAAREKDGWSFTLGVAGALAPSYEGSEDLRLSDYPAPLVDLRWRSSNPWGTTLFAGTRDGVGVAVPDTEAFSVGISGFYGGGRDEDDDNRLEGLGDIDDSPSGKLFGELKFDGFALNTEVEHFFGGSNGTLVTFGAKTGLPLSRQLALGASLKTTFADGTYMGEFFSVTQGQARRSQDDLDRFDADAGFKNVALELSARYAIPQGWVFSARAGVSLLVGDAADSPVVEQAVQPSVGLAVLYRF